jgi:tetratricopeptide (TPR) repeat protein
MKHTKSFAALLIALLMLVFSLPLAAQDAEPNPDAVEGAALYDAGDYEAAFEPLLRAGYANPADTDNLRRLLVTALRTERYGWAGFTTPYIFQFAPEIFSEIGAEAEAALVANPDDGAAAVIAAWSGVENRDAGALVDRVFAFYPDSAIGHDLLGYQKLYAGDLEGALESFDTALSLAGDAYPQFAADFAWVYVYEAGQPERGIDIITQAIEQEPEFALLYNIRGGFYLRVGDTDAALADFDQAIALNPADFQSHNARAEVFWSQGDFDAAYDEYATALSMFALSPSAQYGLPVVAIEARRSIDPLIAVRDLVEADSVLTVDAPYSGEMTQNRIVRLVAEGEPGDYTITVRADDPMMLDPRLIITNGDNIALAHNDDIDGAGDRAEGAYNAQITFTAEAGETYIAYILHSGAGSEGAFTVTLEAAAP